MTYEDMIELLVGSEAFTQELHNMMQEEEGGSSLVLQECEQIDLETRTGG
jgi:hypothetical protein